MALVIQLRAYPAAGARHGSWATAPPWLMLRGAGVATLGDLGGKKMDDRASRADGRAPTTWVGGRRARRHGSHLFAMHPRLSHPSPLAAASPMASCRACLAVAACVLALAPSAPRAAPAAKVDAEGLAQCERAVRQALVPASNKAAELSFSAAPTVLQALSSDEQVVLQGEGQWRDGGAMRKFSYRCNLDPHSTETVGVVIRQAAAPLPARAAPPIEPDLSHLSPSACESSAALALKQRWPQVSKITFDPATRSLKQHSASRAELHGRGRAQPAPQSQQFVHFGFDCALDPRDGRVLGMSLIG